MLLVYIIRARHSRENEIRLLILSLFVPTNVNGWFLAKKKRFDTRCELFCFPHAGGAASAFRSWPSFATDLFLQVVPVEPPGRETRLLEGPYSSMADLATAIAQALEARGSDYFVFFGHSMGAIVAYEVCARLRELDKPLPRALCVSGCHAPHKVHVSGRICALSDEQMIQEVSGKYRGIPGEVLHNPELLHLILPGLRADFHILSGYLPPDRHPLPLPIHGFIGAKDDSVDYNSFLAWRFYSTVGFSSERLDGGHFYLRECGPRILNSIAMFI